MINFNKRSYSPELLDADVIPQADLFQNLKELKIINTLLGGHRVVLNGIKHFVNKAEKWNADKADSFGNADLHRFNPQESALEHQRHQRANIRIVEIGSGGGDNLGAIHEKYPNFELEGVDLKADCTEYAKKQNPEINFLTTDYQQATFTKKPDVVFNSLFCHHFTDEQLIVMLRWMQENSTKGFFIADLHRHWLAYYSIKLLTRLFSKSYLVINDAPLSVLRGFRRSEWEHLLAKAEIKNFKIRWQWAFRFLIIVEHEQN